ncbi:MAG: glycosyltransferase family 2 protein [Bdellovibrionaceae bacterium]|nr:glycosyltransferase family 2 protein [Pseudobdellovibrionaceae bacterium]
MAVDTLYLSSYFVSMTNDFLSIIVPTSAGRLPWSLIRSIKEQSLDSNSYEIILVFNGKNKPLNTLPMPNARMLYSPHTGVNHARNLGIAQARGNVLLFLDDDCYLQNKNYLQLLLQKHAEHPEQMSMGGPYSLAKNASLSAHAYHINRTRWLDSHHVDATHTTVLLGGNASYKVPVFLQGLRFSPGIPYGGSETPFNLQVSKNFGPHLFLKELELEHASHVSAFAFIKKAYLQGKGAAFQKKFHDPDSKAQNAFQEQSLSNKNSVKENFGTLLQLFLWLYDFCFMVGYRTSIYERRFAISSFLEESFRRMSAPFMGLYNDVKSAHTAVFDTTKYPKRSPQNPHSLASAHPILINNGMSLLRTLQTLTKKEFEAGAFVGPGSSPSQADQIFEDFNNVEKHFGQTPENLPFLSTEKMDPLKLQYTNNQRLIFFDKDLSDNYKIWGKDRIEASKIKNPIYYFFTDSKTSVHAVALSSLWPHDKNREFYLLDGVSVDPDVWSTYCNGTNDPYNHFSWNEFIHQKGLKPQFDQSKIGTVCSAQHLLKHARVRFNNYPCRSFYKENLVLLGQHWQRRSLLVKIFLVAQTVISLFPKNILSALKNTILNTKTRIYHWHIEAQESSHILYKWSAFVAHKIYWLSNKIYWKSYKIITFVGAQIIWRTFDGLTFVYLVFNRVYWTLHEHLIGPFLGFLVSLREEPEYIQDLPIVEKYKLRILLFAKKWAWLALRTVRLK